MLICLEQTTGIDGSEYSLYKRDDEYIIRVNGHELMTSLCHGTEERLAVSSFNEIAACPAPRLLVGGLGMGFTLRKLLELLPVKGVLQVAEIEPAVIRWNKSYFNQYNGNVLNDERVQIFEGDVIQKIRDDEKYDAIILDIDNGPSPLSAPGNSWLYSADGISAIYRSLDSGGVFTLWSAFMDEKFVQRLEECGFNVVVEHIYSYKDRSSGEYIIFKCNKGSISTSAFQE